MDRENSFIYTVRHNQMSKQYHIFKQILNVPNTFIFLYFLCVCVCMFVNAQKTTHRR